MKKIECVFLCENVTTRSNSLVMITRAKNERDRKQTTPFAKIGRIGGQTLKGWIRHAMEKVLLAEGISVCHPLPSNVIRSTKTASRNKTYYDTDLSQGYHPRGECAKNGSGPCIIYEMFGDLDKPANLVVGPVLFYPTTSGNGTATKNINKAFGSVGCGRLEIARNSPRARFGDAAHETYMSLETIVGAAIETKLTLILREENGLAWALKDQETLLRKTLLFLSDRVDAWDIRHFLGGMRTAGYGRAKILPMVPKNSKKKKQNKTLIPTPAEAEEPEDDLQYKIQFKLAKKESEALEVKYQALVLRLKEQFSIPYNPPDTDTKKDANGAKASA